MPHVEKLMSLGEANFRCILIKSKACSNDNQYHLLVIYNHAVGDGTSGMIITNQILSLYDEALENPDVLDTEINAEIVKTWEAKIQPDIPNGNQNYEVCSRPESEVTIKMQENFPEGDLQKCPNTKKKTRKF